MAPRKRKADAAMPAEPSDESPYKRARSESIADVVNMQNEIPHSSNDAPDSRTEHSTPIAKPWSQPRPASGKENQAAPPPDLPMTWDQASAADKMLVDMKDTPKISWTRIERCWERSTGEKPANGMLRDRYRHLKDIMAESNGVPEEKEKVKSVEEPFETSQKNSAPPTNVGSPSPVVDGPSDESSRSTVTKPSEYAKSAPIREVTPEQDLPQSWEQANAGDQLIVRMKTSRKAWIRIEEEWQQLTGEKPAKGLLRDRYRRIKDLVIPPKTDGVNTHADPVEVSTSGGASDQAISRRAETILNSPRKQEATTKPSDEFSNEASDESSREVSKRSIDMARRKTRGAVEEQTRASAPDTLSDGPVAKPTRLAAAEPSDERVEARSSLESDEISKPSLAVAKSTKKPRRRPPAAAASGAQSTAETADEMLVEMRESGYNWVDISKAWTERTGLTHAPETLRKRYASIKNGTASKLLSITSTSSKRKGKAASPEQGSYERSTNRSGTKIETPGVAETPVKRNMDRGKRKSSVKYTDSTTDEDELYAAPTEPTATAPTPTRRRAGRAAKVDRSDPEWLVTNEKSPLAQQDLHAEFSNPKTYENFTKSDWEDLRETLPSNVPVNPDGYSIPMEFFKYDPDFRRGIREFQEDLGSGRLDPKWQADAAQAMEARARGDFDAYKEEQFEAFWGQKQKLNHDALAGESTKIKLDLLIQNGLFKVGDYFSYSRVVGRGKSGVLIEKECKIVRLDDNALTVAIPPGQRKYSHHMFESVTSSNTKTEAKTATAGGEEEPLTNLDGEPDTAQFIAGTEANGVQASEADGNRDGALTVEEAPENGNLLSDGKAQESNLRLDNQIDEVNPAEAMNAESTEMEANRKPPVNETREPLALDEKKPNGALVQINGGQCLTLPLQEDDILHSISNLSQLEHKIVDIDGRFNSKDIGIQNTWKNFRGIRKNQDLGSLFEMREDFFVYKHPRIVKEGKRKR